MRKKGGDKWEETKRMKQEGDTGGKQDKRKEATEEYLAGDRRVFIERG